MLNVFSQDEINLIYQLTADNLIIAKKKIGDIFFASHKKFPKDDPTLQFLLSLVITDAFIGSILEKVEVMIEYSPIDDKQTVKNFFSNLNNQRSFEHFKIQFKE